MEVQVQILNFWGLYIV